MTPFDTYIPKLPPSFNNEEKPYSGTQEKETTAGHNFDGMYPALPPSFASLLMDCSGMNQGTRCPLIKSILVLISHVNLLYLIKIVCCRATNCFQ